MTSNTWQRRALFAKEPPARLFLDCLFRYQREDNFFLHEFALMPDHFHLLLTPAPHVALERALQLIKGRSSHLIRKELRYELPIWQTGFDDHRIRDPRDYDQHRAYILKNPVRNKLVGDAKAYPYSSSSPHFRGLLDAWPPTMTAAPQRSGVGTPVESTGLPEPELKPTLGTQAQIAGLKPGPD